MQALPVVVGFGGVNAAGRSSFHQAYRRIVIDSLPNEEQRKTIVGLACMMNLVRWQGGSFVDIENRCLDAAAVAEHFRDAVLKGTLVRRIGHELFDVDRVPCQKIVEYKPVEEGMVSFVVREKHLPDPLPENWEIKPLSGNQYTVSVHTFGKKLVASERDFPVKAGGQLPSGFDPAKLYKSRFQPRGLQMALIGASDAVRSTGIPWQTIADAVRPDEIGVYASSALGQLDEDGAGGLIRARQMGRRSTSKQLPMSLNSMPADFINAYVLGNVGHTEAVAGACASFLYNLRSAVCDIQAGRRRVAVVGNSEAPIDPDIIEGFANMSALATDDNLARLDGVEIPDWRRACRPFGNNCGFTIGESSQYVILMDDALAVELAADIHGAVTDVFINADGIKRSISSAGAGNYITCAKAVASALALLGEESIRKRSIVQAHGSSTPLNRITESHIFHRVAEAFGIENWPVAALKAYLGHSMATASGDQFTNTLGIFRHGIFPGIKTIDAVAADVYSQHLNIPVRDIDLGRGNIDVAFINAKGFGGNNATGVMISPEITESMLARRYGERYADYRQRREVVRQEASAYEQAADRGDLTPIYRFGEDLIDEEVIAISTGELTLPDYRQPVKLPSTSPYSDMV